MTAFTLVLPYRRTSPVHIPRRDLVLGGADCLSLDVSVVESDDPSAAALHLTGGLGGPALQMAVWPLVDACRSWDYGAPPMARYSVLWTGMGVINPDNPGTWTIHYPTNAAYSWPRRCGWSIQLDWSGGTDSELLAEGVLHFTRNMVRSVTPTILLTDTLAPIVTDDTGQPILVDGG